jgi:hypothetical protein
MVTVRSMRTYTNPGQPAAQAKVAAEGRGGVFEMAFSNEIKVCVSLV